MSYYYMKNLKIDKEKEKITAEFAENNVSPLSFFESEISGKTFHEKYSNLIYNIISGNYHPSQSSKYNLLCNTWYEQPLKNFIGDCSILGIERTYDKYKNVIEAILEKKEPEIIKSEIELHYRIEYGANKDYENLSQKVRNISNFMQDIRNNKNLSHKDRLELFMEFQKELGLVTPLVTITGIEHSTKMYLKFNITNDDYTSYNIIIENTETGTLKSYNNENMNITWITDYGENEMAYKMQDYEKKFIIYEKNKEFINKNILKQHSKNHIVELKELDLKNDEIRIFLDMLYEDDRSKDFEYDNKTKKITFNPIIEKEVDIVDEMYG